MNSKTNNLFSIITPIYNSERFIDKTIKSVLRQTYQYWEMIVVYDNSARQVARLINNIQAPGFHSVAWEASSYPSGLYFIRMESNNISETRKVLLIK